jgi:drug/metabolite transporter (DMT)-like permease
VPTAALLLVLLGALIHAGWNIVAKTAQGDARFIFFCAGVKSVVWAPLALWLGWYIIPGWGLLEWGFLIASGLLHWLYFYCLLTGYRKSDLTVVYPVARGSGPLLSSMLAVLLLGEQLSLLGASGIAAVALGVFLIAGGPALLTQARDPHKKQRLIDGMLWGGLTGTLIASYTVVDAYAVKFVAIAPILFDYWCDVLRLPYCVVPVLRDWPEAKRLWRQQWRQAVAVGVFAPIAYVCVLYAVLMAPVSHVAPAREVSMLFAALIGGHLLGESDRGLRLAGAACIALGVTALALG